jgi:DNA-binding XRE family transcriptional regulator
MLNLARSMREMKKNVTTKQNEVPELCSAVKRVRSTLDFPQETFARIIEIAVTTLSRFESGRAIPRDARVLENLAGVAREAGCGAEAEKFMAAVATARKRKVMTEYSHPRQLMPSPGYTHAAFGVAAYSLLQWRLMAAVRTAALYYPERIAAIEEVLGPALTLVDDVVAEAEARHHLDYLGLDSALYVVAEQRALTELKQQHQQRTGNK